MSLEIKDVMVKNVITVQAEDSLKHVVSLMNEHEIGCVVVTKGKRPVGIITERDLLKRVLANSSWLTKIKAQQIMSTPVNTGNPDMLLEKAVSLMIEQKIKKLPVTQGSKLAGLLTLTDILRFQPQLIRAYKIFSNEVVPPRMKKVFDYYLLLYPEPRSRQFLRTPFPSATREKTPNKDVKKSAEYKVDAKMSAAKFKIKAAEFHLNKILDLGKTRRTITHPKARFEADVATDGFLYEIMSAVNSLLHDINDGLKLAIPANEVKLKRVQTEMYLAGFSIANLGDLNHLYSNGHWLCDLRKLRNYSVHQLLLAWNTALTLPDGTSEAYLRTPWIPGGKTKKEVIPYLRVRLKNVRKLVNDTKKRLNLP